MEVTIVMYNSVIGNKLNNRKPFITIEVIYPSSIMIYIYIIQN